MERYKEVTAIIGCHPGEKVGRQVGLNTAELLVKIGKSVKVIPMAESYEDESGEQIKWWRAWQNEWVCLNKREMEEQAIAEGQLPGTLTLSFHDGISLEELGRLFKTEPGKVLGEIEDLRDLKSFLGIEIATENEPTKNSARRKIAESLRARNCERSRRAAHYIEMRSNPNKPDNQTILSDEFTEVVAERIKEILEGRPPDVVTRYLGLQIPHYKLEMPD